MKNVGMCTRDPEPPQGPQGPQGPFIRYTLRVLLSDIRSYKRPASSVLERI